MLQRTLPQAGNVLVRGRGDAPIHSPQWERGYLHTLLGKHLQTFDAIAFVSRRRGFAMTPLLRLEDMRSCFWLIITLSFVGVIGQSCQPESCADVQCYRTHTNVNSALVYNGNTRYMAQCDMATDGGGWTILLLRRITNKAELSFDRDWTTYIDGFGESKKDFWLGLRHMHEVLWTEPATLRFDLGSGSSTRGIAVYSEVTVGPEQDLFRLRYRQYETKVSDAGDVLCTNCQFHTPDNDNTISKCAYKNKYSGWFKSTCSQPKVLLFSWLTQSPRASWVTFSDKLRSVEMKYRPDKYRSGTSCNNPCKNGAACVYKGNGTSKCRCKNGYSGDRCQTLENTSDGLFKNKESLIVFAVAMANIGLFVLLVIVCCFRSRVTASSEKTPLLKNKLTRQIDPNKLKSVLNRPTEDKLPVRSFRSSKLKKK
ncbi:Tenascin-N [Lamellibrachia satsuma]|nr:Tenascin-N [Lamellibrachia satsuma]